MVALYLRRQIKAHGQHSWYSSQKPVHAWHNVTPTPSWRATGGATQFGTHNTHPQMNSITAPPFCVSTFIKQCFVIYIGYAVAQLVWVYELNAGRSRGSIPDGVKFNPSGRTTDLGPTQPLTEMSTTDISWRVKAAGADFLEILEVSTSWSPKGLSKPVMR
jgi:hypothetical protein